MASETEDLMLPKDSADSPTTEETSSGEKSCGGPLKKGPWTSAEDAILVDYVNKHGEGNWNAVQKHSGLFRCGKSCRLRWANHLRPDLKKGAFTPEEERRIIELHAKMGNKWARMAAELPGRTDNEIKNFWNTRIKRRQRAGLPIYPPDISQALHENQQYQNMSYSKGDMHLQEPLPANTFEIPAVEFKNLEIDEQFYPPTLLDIPTSSLLDMPASRLLSQGIGSSRSSNLMYSMPHPHKRLRESDCLLNSSIGDGFQAFEQYQDDVCEKLREPFGFSTSYGHDGNTNRLPSPSALSGCHALINGNSSPSESISWAMKAELPSLQYSDTQAGTWESPFSQPEPMSTLNQSQPVEQAEVDCLSSRNSGLLDAVLYESKTLKTSKSNSSHQVSGNTIVSGDVDSSSQNLRETDWEMNSDPISPLGHSAASVFSECTPISGTSMDDTHMVDTSPGCKVKNESNDWVGTKTDAVQEDPNQMACSRPDFLLASNWFGHNTEKAMEHSILTEAIGALLGDDVNSESKRNPASSSSPPSGQNGGRGESCSWQNPPAACELSGITGNH